MGSGKSEMKRLAIKAISEVSVANHGKKGYKLGGQVANAEVSLAARMRDRSRLTLVHPRIVWKRPHRVQ